MKLSYWDLISLTPYKINNVGSVKAITLREIDNLPQKYSTYQLYIHLFLLTEDEFYTINNTDESKVKQPKSVDCQDRTDISIYDLFVSSPITLGSLLLALNFFFDEEIIFDYKKKSFVSYKDIQKNDNGEDEIIPLGYINRENFSEVKSIILQRCAINANNEKKKEPLDFKNEKAKKLWEKINTPKPKSAKDKQLDANFDLPNIVSSLAFKQTGLNMVNIWDMTVYNIYDQFSRERSGAVYDMGKRSVSTWGDKEKRFNVESWFTNYMYNSNN